MTHKTKGIVLKAVKYGETSLIVTALTELFGLQTYMANAVRSSKQPGKAAIYQPCSILQMEVYHNEQKNLQRIKEAEWSPIFNYLYSDIVKNCVGLYIVELMYNVIKQPETNADLYNFCEDALMSLDAAPANVTANFPLYFSIQFAYFFGFRINDFPIKYNEAEVYFLDLNEGQFVLHQHDAGQYLEKEDAAIIADILRIQHPSELHLIRINRLKRMKLLQSLETYYQIHIPDFKKLKTLEVLQSIFA